MTEIFRPFLTFLYMAPNVILRAWFVRHRYYLERMITFGFVFVFAFVLAHEQAISKVVKWFLGQLIELFSFCLPALDYEWNISCCHFFRIVHTYWPMNCTRTCPIITSCTKLKNLVSHFIYMSPTSFHGQPAMLMIGLTECSNLYNPRHPWTKIFTV